MVCWKGKDNVEERATQRGVSAYTTWNIEENTVRGWKFLQGEEENCVVIFRTYSL